MGLFDAIREKAGELLSGASEKVGELAADVPGVEDLTQSATDTAGQATEAAEDLGATATGAATDATDATDTVTGAIPDLPGEAPEPYRP